MSNSRRTAYLHFALFCLLSAIRDVASHHIFSSALATPAFALWIYTLVTQAIAAATWMLNREPAAASLPGSQVAMDLVATNFFTALAYLTYFLAISSPLGAGITTMADYGLTPAMTGMVGAVVLGEALGARFLISCLFGTAGVSLLTAPRITLEILQPWFVGISLALVSCLSSAIYRVFYKRLLNAQVSKSAIIFFRLFALNFGLTTWVVYSKPVVTGHAVIVLSLLGFGGFTLPFYFLLSSMQNLAVTEIGVLMFAYPVVTLALSVISGAQNLLASDILGAFLVFISVASHSSSRRHDGPES